MLFGVHKMTWGPYFDPADMEAFFSQAEAIGADTVEFRPTDAMLAGDTAECRKIRGLLEKYHLQPRFTYGFPKHLDMRSDDANWANRYGWKALNSYSATQVEEKEAMKKNLHNQGWYHGAGGYFHMSGTGHPDTNGWQNMGNYYCNIYRTIRRVICSNMTLNEEEVHTMRIKSVLALGDAELMIDYIEIVPKSVYGIDTDGEGEDEY